MVFRCCSHSTHMKFIRYTIIRIFSMWAFVFAFAWNDTIEMFYRAFFLYSLLFTMEHNNETKIQIQQPHAMSNRKKFEKFVWKGFRNGQIWIILLLFNMENHTWYCLELDIVYTMTKYNKTPFTFSLSPLLLAHSVGRFQIAPRNTWTIII